MRKNSKKVLVIVLALILLLMAVAYAATTRQLTINGTGKISADVSKIEFTNAVKTNGGNNAADNVTFDTETVTFDVTLNEPSDYREYTISITNNSNSTGKIDSLVFSDASNVSTLEAINAADPVAIKYSVSGLTVGDTIAAGETKTAKVVVTWDSSANIPDAGASKVMKLQVNYGVNE